jgi:T-complex protein 10 C-terminus
MYTPDIEEIPINGIKKSFEELLEEKIREEGQRNVIKRDLPKKEFLRRNSKSSLDDKDYEKKINTKPKYIEDEKKYVSPIQKHLKTPSEPEKSIIRNIDSSSNAKKTFLKRGEGKRCLSEKKLQIKSDSKLEDSNFPAEITPKLKPSKNSASSQIELKRAEKPISNQVPIQSKPIAPKVPTEDTIDYDPQALSYEKPESISKPSPPAPSKTPTEDMYNEKLSMLNSEIERIKSDAQEIFNLNKELKSNTLKLEREIENFLETKSARIKELQAFKDSEVKRIKRERINLEKNSVVFQPNKTDEIEEIKLNLFKIQEEQTIKEFKRKETLDQLSQELLSINNDISSLETQVKIREQLLIKEKFSKNPKQATEKVFKNGIKIKNYPDGKSVIFFQNGDIKETHPDGKVIYQYNEDQITQTAFPDGTEICEFSNGQIEKSYPNGKKEITYPDGTTQCIYPDSTKKRII